MTSAERGALASLSLAQFTTTLEFTVVFVALPSIARAIHLEPAAVPWVAGAYAVSFGGLLVLGGRLADRVGARRLFLAAVTGFAAASVVGTLAISTAVLLIARAAQGVAAAMLQPAVLGLMQARFPREPVRGRAWAFWAAIGAGGLGAGALLGGVLSALAWRLTFAINVPLMLVCALGALRWITPDRARASASRVPVVAAALATGAALALALGLSLAADDGWSTSAWTCLGAAALLAAGFAHHETRTRRPLIDPGLGRVGSLRLGLAVTALYMASVGSVYYLLTLLLQDQWSYGPVRAGLAFVPLGAAVTVGSSVATRSVSGFGLAATLTAGFVVATVGLGWIALSAGALSYPLLLGGLLISGLGNGLVFTAMFVLGLRDVPAQNHGTAGGLIATSQYLASSIALTGLTLALGSQPNTGDYRITFWLLTALAALGAALVALTRRVAADI